ncbi:4-phosphoerythronate dehydrogenase [Geofilum rubicundum]|uniref:Erythronate-4-phosphate dehydrogenase n=1 Tax=Geofilum rubicundum JCM 15548 TaxID=1236989 RepID=A0A0E9LTC8_9BACT|nr:4-phosphoerythronate dehydrogenase [Geofilum rubicundum]GAO28381.1 erythronate-4-phosphate dehydrogenase [Geofilum rubicundum JCM 15548]
MKIVADDKIPTLKGVFEPYAEITYIPGNSISKEDLKNTDALIVRTRTKCHQALLEDTPVKMVATATIGTDHLDVPWLEQAGIKWCNAPGCNSGSVRQYIASVLAHLILEGMVPAATTIGIVGVGMVGKKVAQLAHALGFKVLLNDPPRQRMEKSDQFCDLSYLLKHADIVTFHTPLNKRGQDATFHLFNKDTLRQLKKGAIVINSSRGEVTDTRTLLRGMDNGHLARVVLDVWESEPDIHHDLHQKVWLGTPHIAGYSVDGKANGSIMTIHAIAKEFDLPLTQWQPQTLPMPENPFIYLEATDEPGYITAAKAILKTYNVSEDDARLRENPQNFEKQRGSYPVRREFHKWTVVPHAQTNSETRQILKDLGFILK